MRRAGRSGGMGDHLALSIGIERHFANSEPFAELDQFRLTDQINGRGLAEAAEVVDAAMAASALLS